jgi:hypothetical protein
MSAVLSFISQHQADYNVTIRYATLNDYFTFLHSLNLSFPVQVRVPPLTTTTVYPFQTTFVPTFSTA